MIEFIDLPELDPTLAERPQKVHAANSNARILTDPLTASTMLAR
jgi:hypothetical protein